MQNLKDDLRNLIAEIIERDASAIGDETPLKDLGVDSMQAVEIAAEIERAFKLKIAESELRSITTLASVHRIVEGKLSAATA
ncbi:MAG: acyl carrier protein [Polyangiales bacterium]